MVRWSARPGVRLGSTRPVRSPSGVAGATAARSARGRVWSTRCGRIAGRCPLRRARESSAALTWRPCGGGGSGLLRVARTAAHPAGSHRHGRLNGGPDWAGGQSAVPDPTDLAVHLDGVDDIVSAPHTVDVSKSFAVSAWARLDATGDLR